MKYFKKLEGDNVYLSPMRLEDAEQYCEWLNDPLVAIGLGSANTNIMLEKDWLEKALLNGEYQFAIIKKESNILIGNCSLNEIDYMHQTGTLGIFIGDESERNKGYGAEALKLLIGHAFNYLNLNNIILTVFSFNKNAVSCYKKVGFKEIGKRRSSYYSKGIMHDVIFMDILKSEYYESFK